MSNPSLSNEDLALRESERAMRDRILEGDREAYGKLVSELGHAIEGYLRKRFGGAASWDFLEDCVQESLLAVHRARHSYDPSRPFRPWLFPLVRHKTIDLLRRQQTRRRREDAEAREPTPSRDPEPAQRLDGETVLSWLDPKYREALVLTKLEGYSLQEAATRAGISVTAMKTRVHRAIRSVQKRLGAEGLP